MPDRNKVKASQLFKEQQAEVANKIKASSIPILNTPIDQPQNSLDLSEYEGYMGSDVFPSVNYDLERARNQPFLEQLGRTSGNLLPNIGLGILENVGYLGELISDDQDYSNALTKWAQEKRNPLGESYRENPNEVFDLRDPAWWLNNAGELTESIGEFLVTGAGVGGVLGKTSKLLSKALKAKGYVQAGIEGAAQLGTARSLAYVEGAMSGSQIYQEVLDNGGTPEEAAKAASSTVRMFTNLGTLLNATGVAPLFKTGSQLSKMSKFGLGKKKGESLNNWLGRVNKFTDELQISKPQVFQTLAREGVFEGLEEVSQTVLERRGRVIGGILPEEDWLSTITEGGFSEEAALSGILGTLGGVAQMGAMNYIPFSKEGSADKQARENELVNKRRYAENLTNTITALQDYDRELKASVEEGNLAKQEIIKNKIFETTAKYHAFNDSLDELEGSLEEIRQTSNEDLGIALSEQLNEYDTEIENKYAELSEAQSEEEVLELQSQIEQLEQSRESVDEEYNRLNGKSTATLAGYTTSLNDNSYQEIAARRIAKVQDYKNKYKQFINQYNTSEEADRINVAREVLDRYITLDQLRDSYNENALPYHTELDTVYSQYDESKSGYLSLKAKEKSLQNLIEKYKGFPSRSVKLSKELKEVQDQIKAITDLNDVRIGKKNRERLDLLAGRYNTLKESQLEYEEADEAFSNIVEPKDRKRFINKEIARFNNIINYLNLREQEKTAEEIKDDQNAEINRDNEITAFAKRIINDEELSPEDIQFYQDNKSLIDNKVQELRPEDAATEEVSEETEEEFVPEDWQEKDIVSIEDIIKDDLFEAREETARNSTKMFISKINGKNEKGTSVELRVITPDGADVFTVFLKNKTEEFIPEEGEEPVVVFEEDSDYKEGYRETTRESESGQSLSYDDTNLLTVNAANSTSVLPKSFITTEDGIKATSSNEINPNYPKVLMSGTLKKGDKIRLAEDTEYNVGGVTYQSLIKKEADEKAPNLYRPIQIFRGTESLGYLHDIRWINEDNVADNPEGNIEYQRAELKRIRNAVVNNNGSLDAVINEFTGETVVSLNANRVSSESTGKPIREKRKTSEAIVNPSIELGVVTDEGIKSGRALRTVDNTEEFLENSRGKVVAILPKSNQPKVKRAFPLSVEKTNYADTLFTILESYVLNNNKSIQDQFNTLGYYIRSRDSVRDLISNYIYHSSDFSPAKQKTILNDGEVGKRYISIIEDGIIIQESSKAAKTINENNWKENEKLLRNHLSNMYNNINQERFNTNFTLHKIEDGKVVEAFNGKYIDFVKDVTSTVLWENRFTYKGESKYSYYDNPNFNFSISEEPKTNTEEPIEDFNISDPSLDDLNLGFGGSDISFSPIKVSFSPTEDRTKLETLRDELSKKYSKNFTLSQYQEIIDSTMVGVIKLNYINLSRKGTEKFRDNFNPTEALSIIKNSYQSKADAYREAGQKNEFLERILSDWNEISELVNSKMMSLGQTRFNIEDSSEVQEGFEDYEYNFEKTWFTDDAIWSQDNKFNSSNRLKSFLFLTHNKTKQDEYIPVLLGEELVPIDTVFNTLKNILSDTEPSYELMIAKLKAHKSDFPWIQDVLDKFDQKERYAILGKAFGNMEQIKNEFVSVMTNSDYNFETFLFRSRGDSFTSRIVDTNRYTVERLILRNWIENFKLSPLVDSSGNDTVIDVKKRDELISWYETNILNENFKPNKKDLDYFLSQLNINISDDLKERLLTKPDVQKEYAKKGTYKEITLYPRAQWIGKEGGKNRGIFYLMYSRLKGLDSDSNEQSFESYNPLYNNSGITRLAKLESYAHPLVQSNSFTNGQGNIVNSINQQRDFSIRFNSLYNNPDKAKKLLRVPFLNNNGQNTWLSLLANDNTDFKSTFSISFVDTLREENSGFTPDKPTEFNRRKIEGAKIIGFDNQNRNTAKYVWYIPGKGALSVTAPKVKVVGTTEKLTLDENGNITGEALDRLYAIVKSEINRINAPTKLIEGYDPKQFYFFPQLNEVTYKFKGKDVPLIVGGEVIETEEAVQAIREHIIDQFNKINKDKIKTWKEEGILKDDKIEFINQPADINRFVAEYNYNYLLANYNMYQMFVGDPALYSKRDKNGKVSHLNTQDNISKRLIKDLTSGVRGRVEEGNKHYIQLALQDVKEDSRNYKQIKSEFSEYANKYKAIELTDAQEFITYNTRLYDLKQLGLITEQDYNKIKSKLDNNKKLTDKELQNLTRKGLFRPEKPVATGRSIVESNGVPIAERIDYVKSSSIPLLAQLTEGMPKLDAIRKKMEGLESNQELNPEGLYVRASFKSSNKLGGGTPMNLELQEEIMSDNFVISERSGIRFQQEIPYDPNKTEVIDGTQPRKNIELLISPTDSYYLRGKKVTGKDLSRVYKNTYRNLFLNKQKEFTEKYIDNEGYLKESFINKILKQEALKRNWTKRELDSIRFENGQFVLPPMLHSSDRIQSLLTSIFNSEILRNKRTGNSYTAISEVGWEGYSKEIVYTDNYTGVLLPNRIEEVTIGETKVKQVKPAQILIPSYFKEGLETYVDDQGVTRVDFNNTPPELFQLYGYRIPNSGYNLMSNFEVVGFLPERMGNSIVAPRDVVAQMGMDYDADSLYMFHPEYTKAGNSFIKDNNINNTLLDIDRAVLSDPKIFKYVIEPLSTDKIKNHLKRSVSNLSLLRDNFYNDRYAESVDASVGIGSFATSVTLASQLANKDIYFIDQEGEIDNLSFDDKEGNKLSDINTVEGTDELKSQVLSQFLSAMLDNDKEPIAGALNINKSTFSAIQALALSGYGVDTIIEFINQPVIKEYIKNYRELVENNSQSEFVDLLLEAKLRTVGAPLPNIKNPYTWDIGNNDNETRQAMLEMFLKSQERGQQLKAVLNSINTDSSYLSTSILTNTLKELQVEKIPQNQYIANVDQLLGIYEGNELVPDTIYGFAYQFGLKYSNQVLRKYFDYNSPFIIGAIRAIERRNGKLINERDKIDVMKNIKAYIYSYATDSLLDGKNREDTIKELLLSDNNIATQVQTAKQKYSNTFLDLLNVDTDGALPLVTFNNSAQQGLDEEFIHHAFIELFNTDEKLVDNLIKYTLLTQPIESPTSFVKFIPIEYYQVTGLANKLYEAQDKLLQDQDVTGFVRQLMQHKPKYAARFNPNNLENPIRGEGGAITAFRPTSDDYIKDGVIQFKSYYDKDNNTWRLYEYEEDSKQYKLLNLLGFKQISEYNAKARERYNSILASVNTANPSKGGDNKKDTTGKKVSTENASRPPSYLAKYKSLQGNIKDIIKIIPNHFENRDEIVSLLLQSPLSAEIRIDYKGGFAGRHQNNVITINPSNINNEEEFVDTLLEEAVHAITADVVNSPYNKLGISERKLVDQIYGVKSRVEKYLREEYPEEYSKFWKKWKALKSGEPVAFTRKELDLFYPTGDNAEFVAAIFTNKGFQNYLNSKEFTSDKSLAQRILDIIKEFLASFRTISGDQVKADTELENALTATLSLIKKDTVQNTVKKDKPTTSVKQNVEIPEDAIVLDLDEMIAKKDNELIVELQYGLRDKNENYVVYSDFTKAMNRIEEIRSEIDEQTPYIPIIDNTKSGKFVPTGKLIDLGQRKDTVRELNVLTTTGDEVTIKGYEAYFENYPNKRLFIGKFNKEWFLYDIETKKSIGITGFIDSKESLIKNAEIWFNNNISKNEKVREYLGVKNQDSYIIKIVKKNNESSFSPKQETNIGKFISKLQYDVDFYDRRIHSDANPETIDTFENRKTNVLSQIERLMNNESLVIASEIGREQIKEVEDILAQKSHTASDLYQVQRTLSLWTQADNILLDEEQIRDKDASDLVNEIRDISKTAQALITDNWLPTAREYHSNYVKEGDIMDVTAEELFGLIGGLAGQGTEREINVVQSTVRGLTTTGSPLASSLGKMMTRANKLTDTEIYTDYQAIDKRINEFKRSSFYKENGFKIFIDEKTGNLHTRIDQSYFAESSRLYNKARRTGNKQDWKAFKDFKYDETDWVDVRFLYQENEDGTITEIKDQADYLKALNNIMGEGNAEFALEMAREKVKGYEELLKQFIQDHQDDENFEMQLDFFKKRYSPFVFFENMNDPEGRITSFVDQDGKLKSNTGYNFTYGLAKQQWYNPEFDKIANNKEASEFYDWMVRQIMKYYSYAPDNMMGKPKFFYLPTVSLDFMEEMSERGIFNAFSGVGQRFTDLFTEYDLGSAVVSQDRVTNKKEFNLVYNISDKSTFLTKSEKANKEYVDKLEEMRASQSSTDIAKILKFIAGQSITYKHKKSIEDQVKLTMALFDYQDELVNTRKKGRLDDTGEPQIGGLSNLRKSLDYAVAANFYNINPNDSLVLKSKPVLTKDEKFLKKQLEKMIEETEDPIEKQRLEAKRDSLGKVITSGKAAGAVIGLSRAKGMGLNIFSAYANIFSGNIGNIIEAAGGEYYTKKDLTKAYGIMLNSTANLLPGAGIGAVIGTILAPGFGTFLGLGAGSLFTMSKYGKKISNMMKKIKTLGNIIEARDFSRDYSTGEKKWYDKIGLYKLQTMSEYFTQGSLMVAMMLNKKVTNLNGDKVSLWYAFNEDGSWNTKEFGENAGWEGSKPTELLQFIESFDQVKHKVHGNYDESLLVDSTIAGRAVSQFRRWMFETVANRIEGKRTDWNLNPKGAEVEGRWRLYIYTDENGRTRLDISNIKKVIKGLVTSDHTKLYKDLKPYQQANLRRNIAELQVMTLLAMFVLGMKGLSDDEDDEEAYIANFALNSLIRVQDDLMFYASPTSFENINRSFMPALKTVYDAKNAIEYGFNVAFDEDRTDQQVNSALQKVGRFVPAGSASINAFRYFEEEVDY